MPTIVERAYRRILHLAQINNGPAAAAWNGSNPGFYALTAQPNIAHHYSTPIVNLLQSGPDHRDSWLVASYPPTAACLGMANLLGIRRIVYSDTANAPRSYDVRNLAISPGNAFVAQFDANNYPAEVNPGTSGLRVFPDNSHTGAGVFTVNGPAQNLISWLAADQDTRNNCGVLLAFAIASRFHGQVNANPNRSAAFYGQNIASVMVDGNNQIIGWGLNTNRTHATLHGEVNAIRSYQRNNGGAALPANGRLYTTLEPCAMCSGMLVHCAGANRFDVICGQRDAQVQRSALRAGGNRDGESGNNRTVSMTFAEVAYVPHHQMAASLSLGQQAASPAGRIMQTTRFLEQHAQPTIENAEILLDKMAAVWVPQAQRVIWRATLTQFLQGLTHIAG